MLYWGRLIEFETALVKEVLASTNGHRGEACKVLGVSPTKLNNMARVAGIDRCKPGPKPRDYLCEDCMSYSKTKTCEFCGGKAEK
jgi:hypothetical protein